MNTIKKVEKIFVFGCCTASVIFFMSYKSTAGSHSSLMIDNFEHSRSHKKSKHHARWYG